MRLIIEARLEGEQTSAREATIVAFVEREDRNVADLGLTLSESRAMLAEVQSVLVAIMLRPVGHLHFPQT